MPRYPPPEIRVHGEGADEPGSGVKESAMMAQPAVTEESSQHRQGACRKSLIDERFLPLKRFNCGTAGQRVFANGRISNLRIEFADRPQPCRFPPAPAVQRLAEDKLPTRCVIAKIEPVGDVARLPGHAALNDTLRRARVHTGDQEIRVPIMIRPERCLIDLVWVERNAT